MLVNELGDTLNFYFTILYFLLGTIPSSFAFSAGGAYSGPAFTTGPTSSHFYLNGAINPAMPSLLVDQDEKLRLSYFPSASASIEFGNVDDFVAAVIVLVNDSIAGEFNLFNPELVSMKKFIRKINQLGKHKSLYINIPSSLAINTLIFLNKLGVKLPVNIENIKGLKNNAKCDYQSHLNQLLRQTSSLESMLSKVIDAQ